jgi:Tfp pilus assembly protein PilV
MVMLLLITVMVVTAYSMSTMSLRSVSNAQVREEATAAANRIIEQVVDTSFTDDPAAAADTFDVDINGDGAAEYQVQLAVPICVRATQASRTTASSVTLPGLTITGAWNTIWELDALATETTSGASVRVLQGVRVLLSDLERDTVCG